MRRDVQGLRAIAVWVVIAFHAGLPIPGGFVGVDMFFVISGFVITLTLLRNHDRHGRIRLGEFYVRRFNRLFPALAVVVAFTLASGAFILFPIGPLEDAAVSGLAALLSSANIAIALTTGDYFDDSAELNPLLNTWSLGVEEQFYLVFPVLLLMSLRFGRASVNRLRISFRTVALITATSFALSVVGPLFSSYLDQSILFGFYSPLARAWEFGFGVLIALWVKEGRRKLTPKTSLFLTAVGFSLILVSLVLIRDGETFPNLLTILPVAGTTALILAGSGSQHQRNKVLESRPMQWSGDRSYSFYLWHWPLIVLSEIAFGSSYQVTIVALILTILLSSLSYRFIEQRYRNVTSFDRKTFLDSALKWLSAPLALSAILWIVPSQTWGKELLAAMERPLGYGECHVTPAQGEEAKWCVFAKPSPTARPLYLVGDSNAAHYASGLLDIANDQNRDFLVSTASNCPFLPGLVPVAGEGDSSGHCSSWQDQIADDLIHARGGTVVLGWSPEPFVSELSGIWASNHGYLSRRSDRESALGEVLFQTIELLNKSGHEVILVYPIPHWVEPYSWNLSACSLAEIISRCKQEMPRESALKRLEPVIEILEVVETSTATKTINFLPEICPQDYCLTWNGKYWLYRDSAHITREFSQSLSSKWADVLVAKPLNASMGQ